MLSVIIMSVIMLSVIMLNVIMLSVVMLNVTAAQPVDNVHTKNFKIKKYQFLKKNVKILIFFV
jgi:hypothetical protein